MKNIYRLTLAAILLLAVGCSVVPQAPAAAPTVDAGPIQTAAAQTAEAAVAGAVDAAKTQAVESAFALLTEEAAKNPTATPVPPTAVPATATPVSVVAVTATPISVTVPTATKKAVIVYPTFTKVPYTNACQVVGQLPKDYQVMHPGGDFDAVWTLKNTGKVTWTDGQFYIHYRSGTISHKQDTYYISGNIPVNDTVEVRADFMAPTDPGTYVSNWEVVDNVGTAFCNIYVAITIR